MMNKQKKRNKQFKLTGSIWRFLLSGVGRVRWVGFPFVGVTGNPAPRSNVRFTTRLFAKRTKEQNKLIHKNSIQGNNKKKKLKI